MRFLSWAAVFAATFVAGCQTTSHVNALDEVRARPLVFADYPQAGRTYLSFSHAHGFQVNYLAAQGKAWLWYPGNSKIVPELWKLDRDGTVICWKHPQQSYNPVTQQFGGGFACTSRQFSAKTIVAELRGDPFGLAKGNVPYRLKKCQAPDAFEFDRTKYGC